MIKANITYKSVLTEFTDIKERNVAFNNLDEQSQRLEIAWDALQLVLNDKVRAADGSYWGYTLSSKTINLNAEDTQNYLLKKLNRITCTVCQRGLMMVSQIRLGNELCHDNDSRLDSGTEDNIKGFSLDDFEAMEQEYECNLFEHPYNVRTDEKLANICCNVLVNGNFNTKDRTDYLTT